MATALILAGLLQKGRVLARLGHFQSACGASEPVGTEALALRADTILARVGFAAWRMVAGGARVPWDTQALSADADSVIGAALRARFAGFARVAGEPWGTEAFSHGALSATVAFSVLPGALDGPGAVLAGEPWVAEALAQHANAVGSAPVGALGVVENNLQAPRAFPPRSAEAFPGDALPVPFTASSLAWAFAHVLAACPVPTWLAKALAEWVPVGIAQSVPADTMAVAVGRAPGRDAGLFFGLLGVFPAAFAGPPWEAVACFAGADAVAAALVRALALLLARLPFVAWHAMALAGFADSLSVTVARDVLFAGVSFVPWVAHALSQEALSVAAAVIRALLLHGAVFPDELWGAHAPAVEADPVAGARSLRGHAFARFLVRELAARFADPSWVALALSFPADTVLVAVVRALAGDFAAFAFEPDVTEALPVLAQPVSGAWALGRGALAHFRGFAVGPFPPWVAEALSALADTVAAPAWAQVLAAVLAAVAAIAHALGLLLAVGSALHNAGAVPAALFAGSGHRARFAGLLGFAQRSLYAKSLGGYRFHKTSFDRFEVWKVGRFQGVVAPVNIIAQNPKVWHSFRVQVRKKLHDRHPMRLNERRAFCRKVRGRLYAHSRRICDGGGYQKKSQKQLHFHWGVLRKFHSMYTFQTLNSFDASKEINAKRERRKRNVKTILMFNRKTE